MIDTTLPPAVWRGEPRPYNKERFSVVRYSDQGREVWPRKEFLSMAAARQFAEKVNNAKVPPAVKA